MPERKAFSLEKILYCVAAALGRRGYTAAIPSDLHEFLTGQMPDLRYTEGFETASVACGLILLDQYPQLKGIVERALTPLQPGQGEPSKAFMTWLANQKRAFGQQLQVEQIPARTLRRYMVSARGIALRNLEAKGVDLTADPEDWD